MKTFNIPSYYRSPIIGKVKEIRKANDPRKKDFSPTLLDFGPVQFYIPRHFGFCFGVENAIEKAYKAINENPGKRIFLLSQMIHNPQVNADLQNKGINFIMDTKGNHFVEWNEITNEDVVVIPAFGTTLEIEKILADKGIEPEKYDTTCPFVERVWKKSAKLGKDEYSIVIHGKPNHEETRATFSHSSKEAPSIVVKDIKETQILAEFIAGTRQIDEFDIYFKGRYSADFDPKKSLNKLGVINQTTMLASDTQEIADYLKQTITKKFGEENYKEHFADTRDTLCYATNDNQQATFGVLEKEADLALVVGGYNSSNTSHLVELCERKFNTYFINSSDEIVDEKEINHFNFHEGKMENTKDFLPQQAKTTIVLSSGASCPDTSVDAVLQKILSYFKDTKTVEEVLDNL